MRDANNNQAIVKRLTKRSLKAGRMRNVFAVIAIVLTTFMLTAVCSVGVSLTANYNTAWVRMGGTTANAVLPQPSEKQLALLREKKGIRHVGIEITAGSVQINKEDAGNVRLSYCDAVAFEDQVTPALGDVAGAYPVLDNEILASRRALEKLGCPDAKAGDSILLTYETKQGVKTETFRLSGTATEYRDENADAPIYVSEALIRQLGLSAESDGMAAMNVAKIHQDRVAKWMEKEFPLRSGQEFRIPFATEGSQTANTGGVVAAMGMICLFLVVSGYLLIYNVLYISVVKDIHFYGLLKTIGTSPRQLRKIVRGQALRLAGIGIPIGLVLSGALSFLLVPSLLEGLNSGAGWANAMPNTVSFHPIIFIGATLFSLLTVLWSCRKPSAIASRISPVDALRYMGGTAPKKEKAARQSTRSGKLSHMAWFNIFRDKKRAMVVFLSLFMGIATFLSVFAAVDSLKVENYLNRYVPDDFRLIHSVSMEDRIQDGLLEKIKALPGIQEPEIQYCSNVKLTYEPKVLEPYIRSAVQGTEETVDGFIQSMAAGENGLEVWAVTQTKEDLQENKKEFPFPLDLERFERGETVLLTTGGLERSVLESILGKTITMTDSTTQRTRTFRVGGFVESGQANSSLTGIGFAGAPGLILSENGIRSLNADPRMEQIRIHMKDDSQEPAAKAALLRLLSDHEGIELEIRSDSAKQFRQVSLSMYVLGGGIAFILILIGLVNFVNIMVTSVHTRLKELAVLESVGMTKRQIRKMLTWEGLYYALITSGLILTLGTGIALLAAKGMKGIADYAVFSFPGGYMALVLCLIFAVCLLVPQLVYRRMSRESVTDRMRGNEF